ncbi:bifunctional phosphopantothenoylcysteine decarboxylase/phosphopantothenate--cysteine ligase CoaBC [candidate division WOR-3 bacterium]|nr:bifunctional phosphopantothenoylcysteine decarboxylase/phosphopantothenate--cysteine ligase CoaBC [candidate division WOR-3 bacterium]
MKITLGITGSISAYKAIHILREFKKKGEDLFCVLTSSAEYFVSPLTLSVLSEHKIFKGSFIPEEKLLHISLAHNDLILIAPASYNIIGKIIAGVADDLLTSVVAAARCPVVIAPAMNPAMWNNPIIQNNINRLKDLGYFIIPPEEGEVACGDKGEGRLAEPETIVEYVYDIMKKSSSLLGVKILVTTGRTEENIDSVRVVTNRSSGLMGYEIAKEIRRRGGSVTLVKGATDFPISWGIRVHNAKELEEKLLELLPDNDIVIMAAAVSDFRPQKISKTKIERRNGTLTLRMEPTEDILKKLRKKGREKILIGFSLEDGELIENSKKKLYEKSLDMIVANAPSVIGEKDTTFTIIKRDGSQTTYPLMSKKKASCIILDRVERLYKKRIKEKG